MRVDVSSSVVPSNRWRSAVLHDFNPRWNRRFSAVFRGQPEGAEARCTRFSCDIAPRNGCNYKVARWRDLSPPGGGNSTNLSPELAEKAQRRNVLRLLIPFTVVSSRVQAANAWADVSAGPTSGVARRLPRVARLLASDFRHPRPPMRRDPRRRNGTARTAYDFGTADTRRPPVLRRRG